MKTRKQELEIYRAFLETRGDGVRTVADVCEKLNVAKGNLYIIVRRVEMGNEAQMKKCLNESFKECVWKYRYQQRALIIEDYIGKKYTNLLRGLIKDMRADGFGVREISRFLAKDPSSVVHYLK